jgi:hypothetical protein
MRKMMAGIRTNTTDEDGGDGQAGQVAWTKVTAIRIKMIVYGQAASDGAQA